MAGGGLVTGQTATIGFWQNNNGQALLVSLNGGPNSTQLGNWLAATFPNMYGASAGTSNLTGKTNAEVANFYSSIFRRKKKETLELGLGGPTKMDAQTMAVAFAVYSTNETLAEFTRKNVLMELITKKTITQGLADEIIMASENNGESFAIRKRNESEKQADSAR